MAKPPKQLPSPPSEPSVNQCTYIFPEEHLKAGEQCTGNKLLKIGSEFCVFHTPGKAAEAAEIKNAYDGYYRALEKKLLFWDKPLNSMLQVNELTQEVTRGVLAGIIRKDKAMYLIGLIDSLWKQSKELEGTGRLQMPNVMTIDNSQTLIVNMNEETMDKYLLGDQAAKAQILEELEKSDRIRITKRTPSVIEAEIKEPAKNLFEKLVKEPANNLFVKPEVKEIEQTQS